ncbi:MAG: hypothetical protein H0U75_05560 [Legionella sp.]|nr:hypothetical protein [Legionella sp.]
MKLKEHLSQEFGFSDKLNYAHLIDDGIIVNKDGAYLVTYQFRGPDLYSASAAELDGLTSIFNRMVTFLDDGWMLHVDELRVPSLSYPKEGAFPDSVTRLIDEERRQMYQSEGEHYENIQFITFVWKFPLPIVASSRHWFVEGIEKEDSSQNLTSLFILFCETVERCVGLLSTQLTLEKLNSASLLSYLNTCITGEILPVVVPPEGCFIDVALARRCVVGGYVPKVGNQHVYTLSIIGYHNHETLPGLIGELGTYPLVYRWSNRFIPLSEATAEKEIRRYQRNWNNKIKGLPGIIKEAVFGRPSNKVNQDALNMSKQLDEALGANSNHSTRFGYWTSDIVLMNESIEVLECAAKELMRYIEQCGFSCIKEEVNAFDAWLGTIPGHGSCNVRRVFLNSVNLAHALPLHSIWAGAQHSSPSSLLPQKSPPVFYAATTGKTPFRFHTDISDVGHQLVLGPTGAGKTTYLQFLIAQFLRYEDAQIFIFDKDYSHHGFITALNGVHYDIGRAQSLAFCPLADLSTPSKKVMAEQFIENLVELQNVLITPNIRVAIHNAIESLASDSSHQSRNLTVFQSEVQHEEVRAALQFYTINGQIKLLDSTQDSLQSSHLQAFEMNWLLAQKAEIYVPILLYIFNQIDLRLEDANGEKPTLIILEEAPAYLDHPMFSKKIKDWEKTKRKQNARIVFTAQSLSDLYNPATKRLTAITAAILESSPTRIYLPNQTIDAEIKTLYLKMGFTERQIEIISKVAIPKRHYYVVTPEGNRLIDLGFSQTKPLALAFIGLSKEKTKALLECKEKHQEEWVYYWLIKQGFPEWADYWKKNYYQKGVCHEAISA